MMENLVGDTPTTGWTIWGISPPLKEMAAAFTFTGAEADGNINRVLIEGEFKEDPT